jgi:ABC-type Fe3+/spermidine/putrescine transport system ATPase subunit
VDGALEQGASLSGPRAADIALRGLVKRYGATRALDGVSLDVAPGEFFTLLGPSGCGKTTSLRAIAGFVAPEAGDVLIGGARVNGVPPHRRRVGLVFQNYALFPHRTVRQNVAFGLRMQRTPADEIRRRVDEALALVQLPGYGDRYPRQLSGGEQQRVALARALVTRPAVLLLDEPLGALDKKLRDHMKIELKRLQRDVGVTTIYVTHDQEEALTMSDRVAVMRAGRVEQVGAPREIYETPATMFVAGFIGNTNLLAGKSGGGAAVECGGVTVLTAGGAPAPGAAVTIAIRPERIRLEPAGRLEPTARREHSTGRREDFAGRPGDPASGDDDAAGGLANEIAATVAHVVYQGETVRYVLATDGGLELQAVELGRVRFGAGDRVRAAFTAADARVLTS